MNVSVRIKNRRVIEQQPATGPCVWPASWPFWPWSPLRPCSMHSPRMRTLNISYQASRALEEQREMREEARRLRVETEPPAQSRPETGAGGRRALGLKPG
jgi:hypothetical protein